VEFVFLYSPFFFVLPLLFLPEPNRLEGIVEQRSDEQLIFSLEAEGDEQFLKVTNQPDRGCLSCNGLYD
jgi:hypothetical protein